MTELEAAERFLYGKLNVAGVTALVSSRIYSSMAPYGAALPHVIFQVMAGIDDRGQDKTRQETIIEYIVKGVVRDHARVAVHGIAQAIDTAIDKQIATQNGYRISCHRIAPFSLTEVSDGQIYQQAGGRYRVVVRHNF